MLAVVAASAAAYLIGSLSISFPIARLNGGVDLRLTGNRTTGTRNVLEVIGAWPAAVTLLFDTAKGAGALYVAIHVLRVPSLYLGVPAAAAILGHAFPAYLGMKGGRGSVPAFGMILLLLVGQTTAGLLSVPSAAMIAGVGMLAAIAARSLEVGGVVFAVFVAIQIPAELGITSTSCLIAVLALLVGFWLVQTIVTRGIFRLESAREIKIWRIVARPFAALFILIDVIWGRKLLLFVIGVLALVFILVDLIRIAAKLELSSVFKRKERYRFSSMTAFLVSVFLTFLLFPVGIPYVALACLTFGDFFSKIFEVTFGRIKLYRSRTLEGTLAFLAGSLMFSYVLSGPLDIPVVYVVSGCAVAAVVELFSEHIDDNFTVGIVTGGFLSAIRHFTPF